MGTGRGSLEQYRLWREHAREDTELIRELEEMEGQEAAIEDAFYKNLAFGTGGLRGIMGAGTNRMNLYTVRKASQGLADYVARHFDSFERKIAVSYDSRIGSAFFAKAASAVFAANGIRVCIYPRIMPTPCLSFAVRGLSCAAGVMITASHNPAAYNGYKVYGPDGCQITEDAAGAILAEIERIDLFHNVKTMEFGDALERGLISYIPEEVYTAFVEAVKSQSLLGDAAADKRISIVYPPLNGAGREPVLRALEESGYTNITAVKEQADPDGNFPTCPYPNPENKEAMTLSLEYARKLGADLVLATDPDCDRVGMAVKDPQGGHRRLSGNETGILLLDYICSRRRALGTMPEDPVMVKTIVTTGLGERVAARHGVGTVSVLTGFKFIGEQIGLLERQGRVGSYIFGFEESCGYLSGSYVRDKDGVGAVFLLCEMAAYYAARGIGFLEKLEELYRDHGFCLDTLHAYEFAGAEGAARVGEIMEGLRDGLRSIGGRKVLGLLDYAQGLDGLPKSDVLKFLLEGDVSLVVRPSGTEPKLKVYLSVPAEDRKAAEELEQEILQGLEREFINELPPQKPLKRSVSRT